MTSAWHDTAEAAPPSIRDVLRDVAHFLAWFCGLHALRHRRRNPAR